MQGFLILNIFRKEISNVILKHYSHNLKHKLA
jgi:hypothetical protein